MTNVIFINFHFLVPKSLNNDSLVKNGPEETTATRMHLQKLTSPNGCQGYVNYVMSLSRPAIPSRKNGTGCFPLGTQIFGKGLGLDTAVSVYCAFGWNHAQYLEYDTSVR